MPTTFRPYGPERMPLPVPDVRDRLPEGHLAHRVGHLVDGTGSDGVYAPIMRARSAQCTVWASDDGRGVAVRLRDGSVSAAGDGGGDPAKTRQAAKRAFDPVACPVHSLATFPRVGSCARMRDRGCNPNSGVDWRASPPWSALIR